MRPEDFIYHARDGWRGEVFCDGKIVERCTSFSVGLGFAEFVPADEGGKPLVRNRDVVYGEITYSAFSENKHKLDRSICLPHATVR